MATDLHLLSSGSSGPVTLCVRAWVAEDGALGLELDPSTEGALAEAALTELNALMAWACARGPARELPAAVQSSVAGWQQAVGLLAELLRTVALSSASAERLWQAVQQLLGAAPGAATPSELPERCAELLELVPDAVRPHASPPAAAARERVFESLYGLVRAIWDQVPHCPERHVWLGPLALVLQRERRHRAPPAVMLNRLFEAVSEEIGSGTCLAQLPAGLLLESLLPEHARGVARLGAEIVTGPAFESWLGRRDRVQVLRALGRARELQADKPGALAAYELALSELCASEPSAADGSTQAVEPTLRAQLPAALDLIDRLAALDPFAAEATRADGLSALADSVRRVALGAADPSAVLDVVAEALVSGLDQVGRARTDRAQREAMALAVCAAFGAVAGMSERIAARLERPPA